MKYGRWQVIREISRGGQGTAYLVRDETAYNLKEQLDTLRKAVGEMAAPIRVPGSDAPTLALETIEKYLQRESPSNLHVLKLLHEGARSDAKALQRLRTEVEALQRIDHPNIIRIVDAAPDEGWFVTPYYAGGALSTHLLRFQGRPAESLAALRPLVEAVASLHAIPLVHRDIKPDNIFVDGPRLVLRGCCGHSRFGLLRERRQPRLDARMGDGNEGR